MNNQTIECAIELLWDQYFEMTESDVACELAYLQEEAIKGIDHLGYACRILFGTKLEWALYHAIAYAQQLNKHSYSLWDSFWDEESKVDAILTAHDLASAAKLIHCIQGNQNCGLLQQSYRLSQSAAYYAKALQKRLDPERSLSLRI